MGDRARAKWAEKVGLLRPFPWGLGPHLTVSPGLRSSSVPSGVLIHPAVGPKMGDCCAPFRVDGRGGSPSNNVAWIEVYLRTKWHLYPSNRLATIHQRYSQKIGGRLGPVERTAHFV